ncbi:AAA family ATPase [Rhizobium sp. R339]|uniref:AAA family ATPase n=1 Tax=Rhizobium sp. R339 TaxID=1764273 RepID=UPI00113226D3|nr:AAA family ATPase [Rhizobium sp. R339]
MHSFINPEAIVAERGSVPVRPHYVAQVRDFPLNLLDDRQFEILVYELAKGEIPAIDHRAVSLLGYGADKGRDIVLYNEGIPSGIIQCKRYASSFGLNNFIVEVCKLLMFSLRDERILGQANTIPYELWTSKGITEDLREFILASDPEHRAVALIPEAIEKVRKAYRSLADLPGNITPEEEHQAVVRRFSRLRFKHIGGIDINQKLWAQPKVARWFFRGPSDTPERATYEQIDGLVESLRRQQLSAFTASGKAGDAPYVSRESISLAFDQFLQSGSKVMVVVGGSGFGKTTWLARLLEQDNSTNPFTLIRGDDIADSDDSIAITLGRHLRSGRLSNITSFELDQAVWNWIDSANRIILIDGLDRVPAQARQRLHRWLTRSLALCNGAPVRFVITTRPETWSLLLPELDEIASKLFEQDIAEQRTSSLNSLPMDFLSWDEARLIYAAYGMDIWRHGNSYLRTPSMIANASRMSDGQPNPGHSPTRLAILKARVDEAVRDVEHRSGVGRAAAMTSLLALGRLIARSEDGRVRLQDLPDTASAVIIDEFTKSDLLRVHDDVVRPEMDEIIEYLWASAIDFKTLLESCGSADVNPLKVGALALSVAIMENADKASAHNAIRTIVQQSDGNRQLFEAAARAVSEFAEARAIKEEIRALVMLWRRPNLYLLTSNFGQLISNLRLPALDHLEVVLPLADYEDLDDWRLKYWQGDQFGRFITPFGRAAADLTKRSGPEVISLLAAELTRGKKRSAVAVFLLIEAFVSLPANQLKPLWEIPVHLRTPILREIAELFPAKMSEAVSLALDEHPLPSDENVLELFRAARALYARDPNSASLAPLGLNARRLLVEISNTGLRSKLIMCALMHKRNRLLQAELFRAYEEVDPEDLWLAVELLGSHRRAAVCRIVNDNGTPAKHSKALAYIGTSTRALPPRLWPYLSELIRAAIPSANDVGRRNAALAVEVLLYSSTNLEHLNHLKTVAMEIARSPNPDVRRPLTYFAGTPARGTSSRELIEFKNELLWELVRNEGGQNLGVIGWKILQSAHERAQPLAQLRFLIDRFGHERVMTEISPHDELEQNASWLLAELAACNPGDAVTATNSPLTAN